MKTNSKTKSETLFQNISLPSPVGKGLGVKLLLLCLVLFASCSSSDDDKAEQAYTVETVAAAPTWQVDFSGSVARPDWQEPTPASYENWAIILVQVEDALKPYVSDDDMLAFFVGGELRGLTSPVISQGDEAEAETDRGTFLLKAYGNEADQNIVNVTLHYYCAQLQQIFTYTVQMRYNMGQVYGLEEAIVPQFTLGAAKFPFVKTFTLTPADLTPIDAIPADGDLLATFVGSECRGVTTFNSQLSTFNSLTFYGRAEGEAYTLKYYNAATKRIYTLTKTF